MPETLSEIGRGRLERSCNAGGDAAPEARFADAWIRSGPSAEGIERAEAFFRARAFTPHRHDVYALGITRRGVQTFRYRGAVRACLPGEGYVLHPDELHDGAPGTEDGFGYRIVYVDPELIQAALGGRALPFVADPVVRAGPLHAMFATILDDIDAPLDEPARTEIAVALADGLTAAESPRRSPAPGAIDMAAIARVRDRLTAAPSAPAPMAELERIAGLDRWRLTRQFRAAYGTTPGRFLTLRRLALARRLMESGTALADAALAAGFADQGHMTRHFKRTYGLTPARWVAARAVTPS